jgi:hypothetical protein
MTINTRNPVWANAEKTLIDCEINHPQYGWIPFTASPDDTEQHGRELFAFLSQGTVGAYIAPPTSPAQTYAEKRRQMEEDLLDVSHCLATLSALRIET